MNLDFKFYFAHKLTAYHLRAKLDKSRPYKLFMCSCGWQPWWARKHQYQILPRRILCSFGHDWKEETEIHTGPIDFEESEDTLIGTMKQCKRCYHCK